MISLNQRLRQMVMILVLSITLVFGLGIGSFYSEFSTFQKNEADLAQQLLKLIDLKQHTAQAHSMLETWTYQPDIEKRQQIIHFWSLTWQDLSELPLPYQDKLSPSLTALEVGHWRLMENQKQGLHRTDRAIYASILQPQINTLFQLCTALVDRAKFDRELNALSHAADMRGFFTRAAQSLSTTVNSDEEQGWSAYFSSIQRLDDSHAHIKRLKGLSSELVQQLARFEQQITRFKSNVYVLKQLSKSDNYYDIARLSLENQNIIQHMETKMESLVGEIRKQRQAFEKRSRQRFLFIAVLVVVVVLGFLLGLIIWRRRLTAAIVRPIETIVENSHKIASAHQTEIALPPSNLVEIQKLTQSVKLIRDIVKADQLRVQSERQLQDGLEAINQLMLESDDLQKFCQRVLNVIVSQSGALAAALFVKTRDHGDTEIPLLQASVNLETEQEENPRLAFKGQIRHCFLHNETVEEEIEQHETRIHSALTERTPAFHVIMPLVADQEHCGVIELLFQHKADYVPELVKKLLERLSVLLQSIVSREHTQALLTQTQTQKQKLDDALAELKAQTQALQQSEAELEMQADELNIANVELRRNAEQDEKRQQDLERINTQLQKASRELREANNQKSAFLSKVSHELRTPLNSIMVLTQVMLKQEDALSKEQIQFLNVIRQSGEDLLTLINDLLDLARIEAGKMKFHFEAVRIRDLSDRLQAQFQPIAEQRELKWKISVAKDVPDTLTTDPQRLAQVLRNFLSNAFKFTAKGHVGMEISVQGSYLKFAVKDSGLGISKDEQALIFESFTQVESAVQTAQTGSGLGLSIARQIALALGGYITLDSEKGQGSCFCVFIPKEHQGAESGETRIFTDSVIESAGSPVQGANKPAPRVQDHQQPSQGQTDEADQLLAWYRQAELTPLWGKFARDLETGTIVKEFSLKDILKSAPRDCSGLLLNGDLPLKSIADQDALQLSLQTLRSRAVLVAIVSEHLHRANTWLEGVVHFVIRWNEAGREELASLMQSAATDRNEPTLPGMLPEMTLEADSPPQTKTARNNGKRILLLDDDMRNLFSMSMALRQAGYDTELADSVQMAKEKLQEFPADVVITDLVLPKEDGYDFIQYMKASKTYRNLPLIVMSAKDNQEDRSRCMELGAKDYLAKPVSISDLLKTLGKLKDQIVPENFTSDESNGSK